MELKRINLREDVEWSNTWISKANLDFPRCLLIGDSVTRDIRSTLEKLVADWFAVDFLADHMIWMTICFGIIYSAFLKVVININ